VKKKAKNHAAAEMGSDAARPQRQQQRRDLEQTNRGVPAPRGLQTAPTRWATARRCARNADRTIRWATSGQLVGSQKHHADATIGISPSAPPTGPARGAAPRATRQDQDPGTGRKNPLDRDAHAQQQGARQPTRSALGWIDQRNQAATKRSRNQLYDNARLPRRQ